MMHAGAKNSFLYMVVPHAGNSLLHCMHGFLESLCVSRVIHSTQVILILHIEVQLTQVTATVK